MSDTTPTFSRKRTASQASASGGNAVYSLGLIGALVIFWQQADSFGGYLLAILKSLVWPAFLVYEVDDPGPAGGHPAPNRWATAEARYLRAV